MNIVIVGHVDHGKSTLIGKLLYDTKSIPKERIEEIEVACKELGKEMEYSYLLDALEEERQQNITIDTTQIHFKTPKRNYTIIDAPGHKEFLKNMITGSSQAEAAVLIVAADEGVKEQTKRHAYLLGLLGLKQVIVLVNKMDKENYSKEKFESLGEEIKGYLSNFGIMPKYIIPISASNGENITKKSEKIPWHGGKPFLEALDTLKDERSFSENGLLFPVQDTYNVDSKKIVVGRVESGRVKEGDKVTILPQKEETSVKSVEKWNVERAEAESGESIGLTLEKEKTLERGQVLSSGKLPGVKAEFTASVFWMSDKPLKKEDKFLVRCATQETQCSISKIKNKIDSSTLKTIENRSEEIKNTEVGNVKIKSEKPLVLDDYKNTEVIGRFVIVKNFDTLGAGIITR